MPLPGPSRPQVNSVGLPARFSADCRRDGRAVRDRGDFAAVDVEATTQPLAGRLGHDDHLIGHRRNRLEHRTLVWGRVFEDRMGDHDRRDAQPVDDVHHFVAVGTAVDAVLMLDDRDVALVEQLGGRQPRMPLSR